MNKLLAWVNSQSLAVKIALALGVLLVVGLVILGGMFALGTYFFYDSYGSSYEYEVNIYVDGATEDAVFLLPIGILDGEAHLGEIHITNSDRFDGIDYRIVEMDHGPMLRLEVDHIADGRDVLWVSARFESDRTIETREPRGSEPVLAPLELIGPETDERFDADRWPDRRSYDAVSSAYIEHGGGDDIVIGLSVSYRGSNEWWSFGWSWNEYETVVVAGDAAHDPAGSWIELTGWHTEGAGRYPSFPPAPS